MKNGIFAAIAATIIPSLCLVQYCEVYALSSNHRLHPSNPTGARNLPASGDSNGNGNGNVNGNGNDNDNDNGVESRRAALSKFTLLTTATACSSSLLTTTVVPQPAWAAPVLTPDDADNFAARLERSRREKPPKLLRPKMNQDFAVLLMRSSYNAMDQIDCVAMDQFQKDFFFIRSTEYLPYVKALGPGLVQQGNLTDPYYFDFISFAQYATISRDVNDKPAVTFEEQYGIEQGDDQPQKFVTRVVRRDPSLTNRLLPVRHNELVGTAIVDRLEELFGSTPSAVPKIGPRSDPETVLGALRQLVNLFLINGFAFGGRVGLVKEGKGQGVSGAEFEIKLNAPATLWSGKALQLRKAKPINDFILKSVRVLLSRSGYSIKSSSVKYTSTEEITTFTII